MSTQDKLIAEDEKFIRKGLKTMVQRAPISVDVILEARDGEEALEMLRGSEVDLLITDIRMPERLRRLFLCRGNAAQGRV